MNQIMNVGELNTQGKISSLELTKQVNLFREQEGGNRSELRHDTLRTIIKEEFEEEILSQEILEKPVSSNGGRPSMVFELTLSQAKQVLVRESKFVRKAVIAYIDKLEQTIKNQFKTPQTFAEALQLAADQAKLLEVKEQQILELKPKALYYDEVLSSTDAVTVSVISKDYGMSAVEFNKKLNELKVQYKQGDVWLLYKEHAVMGYTKTATTSFERKDGSKGTSVLTKWTQKGRLFLYELLKQNGILPIIEK